VDLPGSLGRVLPWAAVFVGAVTFALLFAALGSVLLPLKALVMNVLSPSAAFGAMVWGFQDDHLAGVLGFTSTGTPPAVAAFTTSGISFTKLIGVGLLVAVVVDATLVRALLVPATMRSPGRADWWLPAPLRRPHARVALRESG
jgi:trehalose monomycolate/heme transporter